MDEQELIRIITQSSGDTVRPSRNCLSEERIAAYWDQALDPAERLCVEEHLADCDFCLGAIGALVRQQRAQEWADPPTRLLEKARMEIRTSARREWRLPWRWVVVPALAATVVLAAILLRAPQLGEKPWVRSAAPVPQVRTGPEQQYNRARRMSGPRLELLSPRPDSVVQSDALQFSWKPVVNAVRYELKVVDAEGGLIWQAQQSSTAVQFPPDLKLQPGKYFVWVRAYMDDGRTIKSPAIPFTISVSR